MTIRVAGINPCSLINGAGIRVVVFVQGCEHHCKGCQNPDTWDMDGGQEVSISELAGRISDILQRHPYDGLTLSGGDPFYQEEACSELLELLPDVNVWCYTGFGYDDIKDTRLASLCDVIVDGPFVEELKCEGKMYGSSNQRIIRRWVEDGVDSDD